jgi:CRP/FNR family transcriptional regulator
MTRQCSDCGVRDKALCGSLNDAELVSMAKLGVQRRLGRGDTLVRADDPPLVCANLQAGVMKVSTVTSGGSEAIVGLLYPGDFIGRPFAESDEHDVVALTDVELCVFPRAAFERALTEHRQMEQKLLQRTLAELDRARRWLMRMGRATATARVAGFLDDMQRRLATNDCQRGSGGASAAAFELPLSRGEIADLLGLTIETVSRQMTRLRAAGIIDLPGGRAVIIRDTAALAEAAEELA